MLKILAAASAFLLAAGCAITPPINNGPPSEASVKQLLEVTQARKIVDASLNRLDDRMRTMIDQVSKANPIGHAQQKSMDEFRPRMVALMQQTMSWDSLEPTFVEIYQRSLTQSDVDGLLAFYATPTGQSIASKLPVIEQNTQLAMQERAQLLMPQVMNLVQQSIQKMKDGNQK